ncbi:hypothetical protein R5R35_003488 [Gryllus longicercus]|uniref:C2H2-type domain-containing protein n=1 Tax=Gryllus longicercus TaxID=2509291 RepID=A0AAN9VTZ1_9ORTH
MRGPYRRDPEGSAPFAVTPKTPRTPRQRLSPPAAPASTKPSAKGPSSDCHALLNSYFGHPHPNAEQRSFRCPQCGAVFSLLSKLVRHIYSFHGNPLE